MSEEKRYRFLFIPSHTLPGNSRFSGGASLMDRADWPKEQRLANYNKTNYDKIKPLLEDVEWDMHEGAIAPYGDWHVENSEESCLAGRLDYL